MFFDESIPRTISTVDRRDDIEMISRRICLEMADGGKLYMDGHLQKPRAAPVSVCFDGILAVSYTHLANIRINFAIYTVRKRVLS